MVAKSRSAALVVVVALVVIGGVGVAARMLLRESDAMAASARVEGRAKSSDDPDSPPSGDAKSTDGAAQRVELALPARAGSSFAALDFQTGPSDGFAVRVVDARNHQPIAGARVAVVATLELGQEHFVNPKYDHVLSFEEVTSRIDTTTRGFVADAHGIAHVVWPPGPAWVVSEIGELRGARELQAVGHGDFELALAQRSDVMVEVVNARGEPVVGARVTWAIRDAQGQVEFQDGPVFVDARGVARLDSFERPARAGAGDGNEDEKPSGTLGVAVPWAGRYSSEPAAFTALDEHAAAIGSVGGNVGSSATKTVRCVVAGAYGTIAARVLDPSGRLVAEPAELYISIVTRKAAVKEGDAVVIGDSFSPPTDHASFVGGSSSFAPVPLGLDFQVQVQVSHRRWARGDVRGPRKSGETVHADLRVQGGRCHVHGRFVGATSPTAVIASVGVRPHQPWHVGDGSDGFSANVAEQMVAVRIVDGRAFECDAVIAGDSGADSIAFFGIDAASGEPFEGTAALPEHAAADVDLGDVAVHPVAVVASGRVVTETHAPLAGATVRIAGARQGLRTDESGRFLFVGEVNGTVPLAVDAPSGLADVELEIAAGTRDLEIVLERQGAIAGLLLVEHDVSLIARPHGDGDHPPSPWSPMKGVRRLDGVGHARRDDDPSHVDRPFELLLPPGRYDVSASFGGSEMSLLAKVSDVEVVAGRTTFDPRLNPLDLRGAVGRWRIALTRSDGAPPPSTWVRVAAPDRPDDFLQTMYLGVDAVYCENALSTAWIEIARPGFRHLRELHERGEVTLVLEPVDSHPFVVHVTVPRTPHDGEISWRVRAEPSWTAPVDDLDWFSALVGADGTAHLELDEGEHWRIHVLAVKQATDRERRCEVRRLARKVRDDEVERGTLELRLEPEDLEMAAAQLGLQH